MKLKIKPSAKINRRYLLLKGSSKDEIEKVILEYLGVLGWAKAECVFVIIKGLTEGKSVLAVGRREVNNVRAAFEISDSKIEVLKVSETLRGLGVK